MTTLEYVIRYPWDYSLFYYVGCRETFLQDSTKKSPL